MNAISLHARASHNFAEKLAQTQSLLQQVVVSYSNDPNEAIPAVTQASSLGAEDMVISHIINHLGLNVDIFILETGRLHTQTLELLEQFKIQSRAPVRVYTPQSEAIVEFVAKEGMDAMYKSIALRKSCCNIRKMEPLERALAGKKAWITGLRREQSSSRADVPLIDTSEPRAKINPLSDWTWGDVWHYIKLNQVAYNPLHDAFYPSIGCEPCTRAISLGEDFRSGRWWWEAELEGGAAKECGLHVKNT
jgi:phosphoadenosine phosphosulfate reductase